MSSKEHTLVWRILIVIILYILQGIIQGFTASIPLYLASYKASWRQQGTFNWALYPFSFKILWAPVIDSIYHRSFGRHRTWLVPVQLIIGITLVILSFHLESLLVNLQIPILTIVFFLIYFLIATQDIVVDGWSVSLFTASNPQWSSTCQTVGEMIGRFIGTTILLIFESANFTNKYIRDPLSLPHRPYGLFSLQQFTLFWGILFIVVSLLVTVTFFYQKQSNKKNNDQMEKEAHIKLDLLETYFAVLKLFQKKCIRQFVLILLTFNVGFAATYYMTNLTLIEYGITRDTLALINVPLFLMHIIVPFCFSGIQRPLIWFARGYIPRLIGSLALAIYMFFTPQTLHASYYYPVLVVFLCLNEALVYMIIVSRIGVYARISEPRVAGTYMTLLATVSNLGQSMSSTIVLYVANWLPKPHAYSIEVGACFVLGLVWIGLVWRVMRHLDGLSVEEWYLKRSPVVSMPSSTTCSQQNIIKDGVNVISYKL